MNHIDIIILDDHQLFAEGLSLLLEGLEGSVHVKHSASSRSLLNKIDELSVADLLILDLNMPLIDGFGVLQALNERGVQTKRLVISSSQNRQDIETALQLGAAGFVPKNAPSRIMLDGVRTVLNNQNFVPENLVGPIRWPNATALAATSTCKRAPVTQRMELTERQQEVLNLMYSGSSNLDMAVVLNVSESAIKTHVSKIFKALNVRNRTACIKRALELDMIDQ